MITAGMIRISFGIYNTEEEVDEFLAMMPQMIQESDAVKFAREKVGITDEKVIQDYIQERVKIKY